MKKYLFILSIFIVFASCQQEAKKTIVNKKATPVRHKPKTIGYHFEKTKPWLSTVHDSSQLRIVLAINRTDKANIASMDSIIVPTDMTGDLAYYLSFPLEVQYLNNISKIIFFSYPTQTFGAYEYGELIYTGPTNMGRKNNQTPTGLFFTNWKSEKTTSTFNDEWDLLWNFNVANKLGVGWHQYALPGYPASHSCLRLQEKDAKYLYNWADQWILKNDEVVSVNGTPVIIFGSYDFESPKPWYQLITNPEALSISAIEIEKQTKPFLSNILTQQEKREQFKEK